MYHSPNEAAPSPVADDVASLASLASSPPPSKSPSSQDNSARVHMPAASAAATNTSLAFASNYGGMAQGPFLMNTPRNGSGATPSGLSITAPSWYSPSHRYQMRTRSMSRGPLNGFPSARTDDDSFYGMSSASMEPPHFGALTSSPQLAPPQAEPHISNASPVISRARAATFSQISPSSTTTIGDGGVSISSFVAPAVAGTMLTKNEPYSPGNYGYGSTTPVTYATAGQPVGRATGPSTGYGSVSTLYHHHRSITTNSIGSTGTSISKCHLSRKEDHIDPVNMGVATSRELRRHGGGVGNYSTSTLGNTSLSGAGGGSNVQVNQSNSFYQPLHDFAQSPTSSVRSMDPDPFEAAFFARQDDSRYSMHSGRGAAGCSAARSISYAGSQSAPSPFPETEARTAVVNEEEGEDSDAPSAQFSPHTTDLQHRDDDDVPHSRSVSNGEYSFGMDADQQLTRHSMGSGLSPLETSGEFERSAFALPLVAPPSGERQRAFVRRQLVARTVKNAHDKTVTAEPSSLKTPRRASNSCPARVFNGFLDHRQEETDASPSTSTATGSTCSAGRTSPISQPRESGDTDNGWQGNPPPAFQRQRMHTHTPPQQKRTKGERRASF